MSSISLRRPRATLGPDVAVLADRCLDPAAGRRRHVGPAVDDLRDRRDGHAGLLGDVGDRRPATMAHDLARSVDHARSVANPVRLRKFRSHTGALGLGTWRAPFGATSRSVRNPLTPCAGRRMVRVSKHVAACYETFDAEEETTTTERRPGATPGANRRPTTVQICRFLLRWWARSSVDLMSRRSGIHIEGECRPHRIVDPLPRRSNRRRCIVRRGRSTCVIVP